jgi:hypothetical protein
MFLSCRNIFLLPTIILSGNGASRMTRAYIPWELHAPWLNTLPRHGSEALQASSRNYRRPPQSSWSSHPLRHHCRENSSRQLGGVGLNPM